MTKSRMLYVYVNLGQPQPGHTYHHKSVSVMGLALERSIFNLFQIEGRVITSR